MNDAVIQTRGLTRRFGAQVAVNRLDLTVPAGSVFAFLGPNGAGKTTTIRLLLGLLRPSDGEIALFGEGLKDHRMALLRRIGALVESPALYPHLTGEENLRHACLLKNVARGDIARVLGIVGLSGEGGRLVKTYSLGMKQRLGLAQALLGESELVILDEPTNGLDPAGIQEMRHLLRDMPAAHGVTVFLSSHMLSEVDQIASRVAIIARGQLQFQGTPEELRARRQGCLRVGLDRPAVAAQMLRQQGWSVEEEADGTLMLGDAAVERAAEVNRLLVERGFAVHALQQRRASLEDIFLEITQAA
jgi:ABC-2 type transport system ATP-binding protein